MTGPGIYRIDLHRPEDSWSIVIDDSLRNQKRFELNKVYHFHSVLWNTDSYWVYLDSTNNISAYVRGANMIREAMKDETA